MVPILQKQFRRLVQGHCWSYANSLTKLVLQLHHWKNICRSSLQPLLEIQARFLGFYSWKIKMSSLLHVGLILIISKVFTFLCILCLCRNRENTGNFQDETAISKLFFQMSAQVKWVRGKAFMKGTRSLDLSSKLSIT